MAIGFAKSHRILTNAVLGGLHCEYRLGHVSLDRGYDAAAIRRSLRTRYILPLLAKRRTMHGSLGRCRWSWSAHLAGSVSLAVARAVWQAARNPRGVPLARVRAHLLAVPATGWMTVCGGARTPLESASTHVLVRWHALRFVRGSLSPRGARNGQGYRARHRRLNRYVAIKALPQSFAAVAKVARSQREAQSSPRSIICTSRPFTGWGTAYISPEQAPEKSATNAVTSGRMVACSTRDSRAIGYSMASM